MAARHGTRARYYKGNCRCAECRAAQAAYQRRYRDRVMNGETRPPAGLVAAANQHHGGDLAPLVESVVLPQRRVEAAVEAELADLPAAADQPGIAAACLALARVLDNPRHMSPHPSAARVLSKLLADLRSASARTSRGGLAAVRSMSKPDTGA